MTMLRLIPGIRLHLGAVLLVALLVLAACGSDDESSSANGRSDSERIVALEEQMKNFQEYIVAQAKKEREVGDSSIVAQGFEPLYTLAKKDASENEREIVRWMADARPEPISIRTCPRRLSSAKSRSRNAGCGRRSRLDSTAVSRRTLGWHSTSARPG